VIKGRTKAVQTLAKALRDVIFEELPDAQENFYGGTNPMARYRTTGEVCWIQPLASRCNVYFVRGPELTDEDRLLEGKSDRMRHLKVGSLEAVEQLPIRDWLQESVELNDAVLAGGMNFEEVLEKLRSVGLALPDTKETLTWGMPHIRVGEKIFCGCAEISGRPTLGLKMEKNESVMPMKAPGVEKAPYSRPGDGWVVIDPNVFDDWDEVERLIVGSFRLIAPKRTVALLDAEDGS
jgi:predicted DNA-binding protein (MmcQ/YjbR family)